MGTSPVFGIPLVASQQAQPEVTHNEAVMLLSIAFRGAVSLGDNAPPGSPAEGDVYVLGSAPTGVWTGKANKVAIFFNGAWNFLPGLDSSGTDIPIGTDHEGLRVYVNDEDTSYVWTGVIWSSDAFSGAYVKKSGDTMTGRLQVNRSSAALPADAGNEVFAGLGTDTGITRLLTYTFGSGSSAFSFWGARHARGVSGTPAATQNNDILLIMGAAGFDGSNYGAAAQVRFTATETHTPTAQGMKVGFYAVPNGAINTGNPVIEGQGGVGISMFGQTIITTDSLLKARSYTVATLPTAGTAGRVAYASNGRMFNGTGTLEGAGAGTGGLVVDNGTAWKIAGTNVTVSA